MRRSIVIALVFAIVLGSLFLATTNRNDNQPQMNDLNKNHTFQEPENIILVTVEALRRDNTGLCYNHSHNTTPTICNVANDGILFEDAYAQSTNTYNAIPTLFTGKYPMKVGSSGFESGIKDLKTISTVLRELNYTVTGKGKINVFPSLYENKTDWATLNISKEKIFYWFFPSDPHFGYNVEAKYRRWDNSSLTEQELEYDERFDTKEEWLEYMLSNVSNNEYRSLYDSAVYKADTRLKNLVSYLKKTNNYRESLIIITGDHGTALGKGGRYTHHIPGLNEDLIQVPVVIKLPGNTYNGTRVSAPIRHVDITPTILDLLNKENALETDGKSLIGHIQQNKTTKTGPIIAARNPNGAWAIKEGEYKYQLPHTNQECFGRAESKGELYRIKNTTAVESQAKQVVNPSVMKSLRDKLCRIYTAGFENRDPPANKMDNSTREQLEALGYFN